MTYFMEMLKLPGTFNKTQSLKELWLGGLALEDVARTALLVTDTVALHNCCSSKSPCVLQLVSFHALILV